MSHLKTLTLALAALLVAGPAAAEPVGFLAVSRGDVQVQPYGTSTFQAAVQDMDVSVGDTIVTGFDAQAKVILVDDTTLSIDEDTEITIQSLHVGAAATQDRSIIRQTRGKLRTVVGSAFGGQTRMEIHTPTAVVGVKGTDLTSEKDDEARLTGRDEDKGKWLFCLMDGHIVVRAANGVAEPQSGNCVLANLDGSFSDEIPNNENFVVSFDQVSFGGDFVNPGGPGVGSGGGLGENTGYEGGTGETGGGPGGEGGEGGGSDEFGPTTTGNEVVQMDDEMEMEEPPGEDEIIEF